MARTKRRPRVFEWESDESDPYERLRYIAARKLCKYEQRIASTGSVYIVIDESLTVRFSDHEASSKYDLPDFDFVGRRPTDEEFQDIEELIDYPHMCRKTAFALHVGLTIPRMRDLLTPDCYGTLVEDGYYFGTFREVQAVLASKALETLERHGICERKPVRQEIYDAPSWL